MPWRGVLGGVALACVASGAEAADARHRFAIPPKPYADALIDLGVQANISIVGTSACGAGGRVALSGRFTLAEALERLLAGAPCGYRIVDPRTVRIFAAAPTAPPPPPAQPEPRPPVVAELVVTATKRPASLERLPAGVSAIPGEQLQATGAVDVGRTVGQVAGVLTTNLGPGRDKLLIRALSDGAFTGRARSTVSTYLDETPLNYNAPDPDLRLVDVERIEVIRGPQGALYGSGAISGIYRIVTRKPDLTRAEGGVLGGLAWTRGGDASREAEGYLSLPLVPGRAAVRLAVYEDRQGGHLDDVNLGLENVDRTVRDGGRLALRVQMGEGWRLDTLAAVQNLRSNDTQYVVPGANRVGRANRIREVHNNDFRHAAATLQGDLGWASLASSTAYVRHDYSSQYDATNVLTIFNVPNGDVGVFTDGARVEMLVEDLVLRSGGGQRVGWLLGLYAATTIERTPSTLRTRPAAGGAFTAYDEMRKDRHEELAAYGEAEMEFAPGWRATVGGRLFHSRVRTFADVQVAPPGESRAISGERRFRGLSPKIAVQREFGSGDMIYALFSEGYRPGGFNSAGLLHIREARRSFRPDRLRNLEVGAKLRLMDGRMVVRSAAYYDDWSNIQTDQHRPTGLFYTANVGDARILGLEAEASYVWDFGLSLQANALFTESEIRNPNPDFTSSTPNANLTARVIDDLPGVPKVSGGLVAIYQRPLAGGLTLRVAGDASYVGRSQLSFDAALRSEMGGYLRTALTAEIGSGTWRAAAYVTNPINDAGDTFAYGNPFSVRDLTQVTPQRPRTVGVRLAAGF